MSTTAHGNGPEGEDGPDVTPEDAGQVASVPEPDATEGDEAGQSHDEESSDPEPAAQDQTPAAAADPHAPTAAPEEAEAAQTRAAGPSEAEAQVSSEPQATDESASQHHPDAGAQHPTPQASTAPPAVAADGGDQEPASGDGGGAEVDLEQTHVAIPTTEADPFSEVDGGDESLTQPAIPTPEEDAALRDERARRFGRPQPGAGPAEPAAPAPAAPAGEPAAQEPTQAVPLAEAGEGAVAAVGGTDAAATQTMPATEEDPFKDFDEGPQSRTASHWWTILISIVFVPLAWYLIADGGERMTFTFSNDEPFNPASAIELGAGALCLFFVLLAARWSSVGSIITGSIATLAGGAFLVFNAEAMDYILQYQGTLVQALDQVGQNIIDHLLRDAEAGRIVVYGIVLIMCGVISHGARRQGRREERRKAAAGL